MEELGRGARKDLFQVSSLATCMYQHLEKLVPCNGHPVHVATIDLTFIFGNSALVPIVCRDMV
jgi:hypothetical protein